MTDTDFGDTDASVGVIMGSRNDWETMRGACEVLDELTIPNERFVRVGTSDTQADVRLREQRSTAWDQGDHRRCRWRGAPTGDGGIGNHPSCDRGPGAKPSPAGTRFLVVDRANARRYSGCQHVDRTIRCQERGDSGGADPVALGSELSERLRAFVEKQTTMVLDSAEL